MVNAYVSEVEQFYLGGANNVVTQGGAAALMTGVKVLTGLATAGDQLADQVGTFGGQATAGEFHKENIPVVGPVGTRIGESTAAVAENPGSVEAWSDAVGAYSEGALLALSPVQVKRGVQQKIRAGQDPKVRGRQMEAKVVKKIEGRHPKRKVESPEGKAVPDYETDTTIGDVKDVNELSNTKQMRIERHAAKQAGKVHEVTTGTNTKVSNSMARQSRIVRRPDLGPPTPTSGNVTGGTVAGTAVTLQEQKKDD